MISPAKIERHNVAYGVCLQAAFVIILFALISSVESKTSIAVFLSLTTALLLTSLASLLNHFNEKSTNEDWKQVVGIMFILSVVSLGVAFAFIVITTLLNYF